MKTKVLMMRLNVTLRRRRWPNKPRTILLVNHGAINAENSNLLYIKRGIDGGSYLEFPNLDI